MRQRNPTGKACSTFSVSFYVAFHPQLNSHCVPGIFENILGFNSELSTQLVSKTKILSWVMTRIESPKHDENRGYAAEILSILLQNNRPNRLELGKQNGVESILKILSVSGVEG